EVGAGARGAGRAPKRTPVMPFNPASTPSPSCEHPREIATVCPKKHGPGPLRECHRIANSCAADFILQCTRCGALHDFAAHRRKHRSSALSARAHLMLSPVSML